MTLNFPGGLVVCTIGAIVHGGDGGPGGVGGLLGDLQSQVEFTNVLIAGNRGGAGGPGGAGATNRCPANMGPAPTGRADPGRVGAAGIGSVDLAGAGSRFVHVTLASNENGNGGTVPAIRVAGPSQWLNGNVWGNRGAIGSLAKASFERCNLPFRTMQASNLSQVPLFVDLANGDFRLGAGSPLRDAGATNLPLLPAVDLNGDPRSFGAAPDLGPDEWAVRLAAEAGSVPGGFRLAVDEAEPGALYQTFVSLHPSARAVPELRGLRIAPGVAILQFTLPVGAAPFRVRAPGESYGLGPFSLPLGHRLEAVMVDVTTGTLDPNLVSARTSYEVR